MLQLPPCFYRFHFPQCGETPVGLHIAHKLILCYGIPSGHQGIFRQALGCDANRKCCDVQCSHHGGGTDLTGRDTNVLQGIWDVTLFW